MKTGNHPTDSGEGCSDKCATSPDPRPRIATRVDGDDTQSAAESVLIRKEDEMSEDVHVHFAPQVNDSEVYTRYLFHTRRQDAEESLDEFITGLHALASCCCFDFLRDSLIRDRVVVGVREEQVRQRLLQETSLPLERCIELCREFEAISRHCEDEAEDLKPAKTAQLAQEDDSEADCGGETPQWDREDGFQEAEVEMKPTAFHLQQTSPDQEQEDNQAATETPAAAEDQPTSSEQFTCTECSVQFTSLAELQTHTGNMHVKSERNHVPPTEEPGFSCSCGQQFRQLHAFQNHKCRFHKPAAPQKRSRGRPGRKLNNPAVDESPTKKLRRQPRMQTRSFCKEEEDLSEQDSEEGPAVSPEETNLEENSVGEGESHNSSEASTSASNKKFAQRCPICSKGFKKSELKKYLGHRIRCKKTQCELSKAYGATASMPRHLAIAHKQRHVQCASCLEYFSTRKLLKDHVCEAGHKSRELSSKCHACSQCSFVFSTKAQLLRHGDIFDHEARYFKCSVCYEGFRAEPSLVDHMTADHGTHPDFSKVVLCQCGRGFPSEGLLQSHEDSCNKILCQVCGDEVTASQMTRHTKELCGKEKFFCLICEETFKTKSKLLRHTRVTGHQLPPDRKTMGPVETNDSSQSFTCDVCMESFSFISDFTEHLYSQSHLPETDGAQCPVCKKFYQDRYTLKDHLLTHSVERPYVCDQCGLAFKKKYLLQNHCYIHTGEKRCKCEYCGRMFNQPAYLKKHLRLHTGERPYECQLCGQRFHVNSGLFIHMRRHTGERPYTCEVCGKSYIMLCHLKNHRATHSEERPFSCPSCGRGFKTRKEMRAHEFLHTGIKRFVCQACGMEFARSSNLAQHIRKYHPELTSTLNTKTAIVPGPAEVSS